MKINRIILFLLLSCANLTLFSHQRLTLDLEGARNYAIEHNKLLINSGYAMDKARLALNEAIANGLPQVNASMDYSNALGAKISIRFNENMPASQIDIKPQSNFYLSVGQLLFSGNYIVGVQTAKLYREMSLLGHEKTELEVITQVTDAYYLVLISGRLKELLKHNLENLNALYEKTSALEHVGIIEKTDLDQLWVQVNNLKNAVSSAERQHELSLNLLRLQIGASVETEIVLTDSLEDILTEAGIESLLLQHLNVAQHIDFKLARQQELIGEKMINMQRSNALPTLSAYYRFTYKLLKPDFDMSPRNMVGLQMNIPIFSSGVRTAKTKQAVVDLKTTQNNIALLSDQLKIQEKQFRFNLSNALETWDNQKNNVEVARRVYQSLKNKYEQGLISGLDLIAADNNYLRAETDYISAMMQVLTARLQLEKLYGSVN